MIKFIDFPRAILFKRNIFIKKMENNIYKVYSIYDQRLVRYLKYFFFKSYLSLFCNFINKTKDVHEFTYMSFKSFLFCMALR